MYTSSLGCFFFATDFVARRKGHTPSTPIFPPPTSVDFKLSFCGSLCLMRVSTQIIRFNPPSVCGPLLYGKSAPKCSSVQSFSGNGCSLVGKLLAWCATCACNFRPFPQSKLPTRVRSSRAEGNIRFSRPLGTGEQRHCLALTS